MSRADVFRTAAVELIDQHGKSIVTVPAHCAGPDRVDFRASPDHVEHAWVLKSLDAQGNVVEEAPTPIARGMQELADALSVAFAGLEVLHAPE